MKQYDINPRHISDSELQQLKENLRELGDLSGIVHDVNSDYIISGNQRSKVFDINDCEITITEQYDPPTETGTIAHGFIIWNNEKYAYRKVDWTQEQCKKANITANKLGGEFDWDELANSFDVEELTEWGFEDEELFGDGMFEEQAREDDFEVPDEDEIETDIQEGDLIAIGRHRLLCADSTDSEQVEYLMQNGKADLLFTDPPHDVEQHNLISFIEPFCEGVKFVLHNDLFLSKLSSQFEERFERYFVHDFVFHIGGGNRFYSQNDLIACFDYSSDRYFPQKDGFSTVIRKMTERQKGTKTLDHQHQKPIYLLAEFISHFSKEDESILDLYLGSGTTMVAAHQLDRTCYGMELDPKYCQVIIDRMLKLEPSLEVKVNNEPYGISRQAK